jgi:hypothetical protein
MGLEGLPPGGLSMSPGDRRGRVRLSLSPAEETTHESVGAEGADAD